MANYSDTYSYSFYFELKLFGIFINIGVQSYFFFLRIQRYSFKIVISTKNYFDIHPIFVRYYVCIVFVFGWFVRFEFGASCAFPDRAWARYGERT